MQTQTAPLSPPLVVDRDREFDQTAKTDTTMPLESSDECFYCAWPTRHGHKVGCPKNDTYRRTPDEFFRFHTDLDSEFMRQRRSATPKTVSPAILEFRIQELTDELNTERRLHGETIEKLLAANNRIAQFEKMAAALVAKIDEFEAGFKADGERNPRDLVCRCGHGRDVHSENYRGFCRSGLCECSSFSPPISMNTPPDCGRIVATPNEYEIGRCIFPAGHTGGCSIGV